MGAVANNPPVEEKRSAEALPWYEDPARLRQKREELDVSYAHLAKIIGRHPSYIEEIEAGRIALKWEENGELIWSTLIELQLNQGRVVNLLLGRTGGQRSYADMQDEIRQLRQIRDTQNEIIRNLTETSACWEEKATHRAEIIRELRIELGENPDAEDEEEQL